MTSTAPQPATPRARRAIRRRLVAATPLGAFYARLREAA